MNKKQIMKLAKRMTAGVLAVGMIATGIAVYPEQADATETVDLTGKVIYDETYQIGDYWLDRKAPVKTGFVFGGWFTDATDGATDAEKLTSATDGTTVKTCVPLTKETIDSNSDDVIDAGVTAYAKFVPAEVLSVKAQNSEGITQKTIEDISEANPMQIRVMTSMDSKNYAKVGFEMYLGNWRPVYADDTEETPTETNKFYDGIMVGEEAVKANSIFGGVSKYVSVWRLIDIDTPSNAGLIIYVRPYWETKDGTKVEGLAKYVHIEDEYMNYISVPINILNKEDAAKVAAGAVNMTYTNANAGETVALTFKQVETGRLLPEMNSSHNGNVIKMVGNAKDVDTYNSDETLYANVRFIKPTDGTDVDVNFTMNMVQFCDWSETPVIINEKWDVKHDVKETIGE